jgi:hypothetical protein
MAVGGLLSEHEAREGSANESDDSHLPEMEPDEKKAVKLVMHLWHKSKRHRSKYDKDWINNYRFFRGDQWVKKRPSYLHSEVINFVFQTIQAMVPIMTDARPKPSFLPQDPTDLEFTEVLNDVFESDWQKGNWLQTVAEVIYDAHFYGTSYSSVKFNPQGDYGLGRIIYCSEDPLDCYPDPDANDINDDEEKSTSFITAMPTDVEKLRLKYKGHRFEAALKSDIDDLSESTKDRTSLGRRTFVRNTDSELPLVREFSDESFDKDKKALVITAYMKPSETTEEEEEFDDGEGNKGVQFITKKKYPRGRKITVINGYLFDDQPNLDNDDGRFPFQKLVNYILPREFYGMSEIEQLSSPQRIFNKLISFTLDVLTLMGNPVWLIPTSSGVKPGSFTSAPGMQIPYDGAEPPRRAEGTQLQPYVMQMIDRMEQWFNGIAGNTDVSQGITPGSVTAAAAIENLQDAAKTRVRQKMRQLDGYLVQVGSQWVQLALQHYSAPRIFRLTNKEGMEKYFKFHTQEAEDEQGQPLVAENGDPVRIAVVTKFKKDESLDRMVPDETKKMLIRGGFDVKVNTGSGLPFAKGEKEQRLLQLYTSNVIDRRALLEHIEFPNFEPILQRMEQAEQAAAAQGAG